MNKNAERLSALSNARRGHLVETGIGGPSEREQKAFFNGVNLEYEQNTQLRMCYFSAIISRLFIIDSCCRWLRTGSNPRV